jgi:tetratricopeptide (TPR) repeat protein
MVIMIPRRVKRPQKGGKKSATPRSAAVSTLTDREYAKLLSEAQELADEMNIDGAVLLYEEALLQRPHDVTVMDALGESLFYLGQMERAEAVLRQSAEAAPSAGYSKWMYLGQILEGSESMDAFSRGSVVLETQLQQAQERLADGTAHLSLVKHLQRELSDAYCSIAELHITDLCDEASAEANSCRFAELAVSTDDTNPEAHRVLGNVRLCQSKKTDAASHLARAVELIEALYPDEEGAEHDSVAPSSMKFSAAAAAAVSAAEAAGEDAVSTMDFFSQLPQYDARLHLAKDCMEVELWEPAVTILERLLEEDDSNMEVFYLTGEANLYSGDVETARERLTTADEMLSNAITRVRGVARKAGKGSKASLSNAEALAYVADELMALDLDELICQQTMIRKLLAVVNGEAAPVTMQAADIDGEIDIA